MAETSAAPRAWASWTAALEPRLEAIRGFVRLLTGNLLATVGLALVLTYVFLALLAPWIAPLAPGQADAYEMPVAFHEQFESPSASHPFGTTDYGADLLYGVVWGSRLALAMGVGVVAAGVLLGAALGALAGYYGGSVDEVIMRLTDVFLSLPVLVLAMAMVLALGQTMGSIALALALVWWPPYARLARAQVLQVREHPYVEAARASGVNEASVIFRHVMPNCVGPIVVQATLDVGTVALLAAGLAYIGFTPSGPLLPEWGTLIALGHPATVAGKWWAVTFPGVAIFGFVLGFNLLGDGLRDVLDPKGRW